MLQLKFITLPLDVHMESALEVWIYCQIKVNYKLYYTSVLYTYI